MSDVIITHVFDAPRDKVFRAWASVESLKRWYAPKGCAIEFAKHDFRPGGASLHRIRNPAFGDCWCKAVYHEIAPPEKIVYFLAVTDEKGNPIPPAQAGHDPAWPAETVVAVTLEALPDGKTKLTLRQNVSEDLAKRTGAHPSWLQMLDNLGLELAAMK